MIHPGVRAMVDQLIEEARAEIPGAATELTPAVAVMLCDLLDFLAAADDHVELRLRVLAVSGLVRSIQENPPCSDPLSSGPSQ